MEIKEKIKKEYLRRTRKLLETKLNSRNLIKWIKTWAVSRIRYSELFLKWTREDLKQMDQRTRKQMTMFKVFSDRLYVSRKEGGRGLTSIEDGIEASIPLLEDYIEKRGGRLITATRNYTDDTWISRTEITRKKVGRKITPWTFQATNNRHLTRENVDAAKQWKPLERNWISSNSSTKQRHKTQQNSRWRLCGDRDETFNRTISECSKLAQKEYKTRHDYLVKMIHWELCKKFKFDHTNKWYLHNQK